MLRRCSSRCQQFCAGFLVERFISVRNCDCIDGCLSLSILEVVGEGLIIVLRSPAAIAAGHCREDADAARLVAGAKENDHV